tara:strand:+ start:261 stop:551 length:291 start_codon:yes stop_codon:yes gene_type:complete
MNKTVLFLFSATGLLVVNNLFLYWWFFEFDLNLFLSNTIGVALFIEAFLLMLLLAYYFKRYPIGKYKWYWLIILSLLGSLLFALPLYYWLNTKDKK